jgi:hypothetical protein
MGVIVIRCPRTGSEVSTGVEIDADRFKTLPPIVSRMRCPACGSEHAWSKRSASFKTLATPEPDEKRRVLIAGRTAQLGTAAPERRDTMVSAPASSPKRGSVRDIVSRLLGTEEKRADAEAKLGKVAAKAVPQNEARRLT